MITPKSRDEWIFGCCKDVLNDKQSLIHSEILQMLKRSVRIFEYTNLPDTIQHKDLETQLQVGRFNTWKEVNGDLYCFNSSLGGEPNPYYLPTKAIIANPALKYNATLTIDKDCVVMLNDSYYQGFMPLFTKYASLLIEAELSLKYAIINARVPALIQADNDGTYKSATEFFDKIVKGEGYGIVSSKEFFDGIRSTDFYKQAYIKDLIEAIQYIKGSWFNAIGLNAQFNMKREAINEAEASLNEDVLYPTLDDMLECRQFALEKINKMFGTNISVKFSSVWEQNKKQEELSLDIMKIEAEGGTKDETDRNSDRSETVANA